MEKEIRTSLWIEDGAKRVRAFDSDFEGSNWKLAFYEVWRYQMGWRFAYEITVHEVHGGEVCVSMLIKPAYEKNVLDMMESLGYRNVQVSTEHVGVIEGYAIEAPEAEDMFTVVMD